MAIKPRKILGSNQLSSLALDEIRVESQKQITKEADTLVCLHGLDEKKLPKNTELRKEIKLLNKYFKPSEASAGLKSILPSVALLNDYVPSLNDPLKFLCINIHFIADDNGDGVNYISEGGVEPITVFNMDEIAKFIFLPVHRSFVFNDPPSDPADCPYTGNWAQGIDTRIRPILSGVYFHKNTIINGTASLNSALNYIFQKDEKFKRQLNVIVGNGISGFAYVNGLANSNPNHHHGVMFGNLSVLWGAGQILAHEIGHVLGLRHTYLGGGASTICDENHLEFMADIHGCSDGTLICPHTGGWGIDPNASSTDGITNNLMGGVNANYWTSTMQAAYMHFNIKTKASLKKYFAHSCGCTCFGFGAFQDRHVSSGAENEITFEITHSNVGFAWDGKYFTAASTGDYRFAITFEKDSYYHGGTSDDVTAHIKVRSIDGSVKYYSSAWAGQHTRRASAAFSNIIPLKQDDMVSCVVKSDGNRRRHIRQLNFSGNLVCSC